MDPLRVNPRADRSRQGPPASEDGPGAQGGSVEQVALRLDASKDWTYLGGLPEDVKKPAEVVIRAFEAPVLAATGAAAEAPDAEPVRCGKGEGIRLIGRHFFVRGEHPGAHLVSYRGLPE